MSDVMSRIGLDPVSVLVTDDFEAARAFYLACHGGVLHIVNEETDELCRALDAFNASAEKSIVGDAANTIKLPLQDMMKRVTRDSGAKTELSQPQVEFGWDDPPHAHSHTVGLLVGYNDRPTEISAGPLVKTDEWYNQQLPTRRAQAWREEQWGEAPNTLLDLPGRGLTILVPCKWASQPFMGVAHRVPRQRQENETRGHIASARLYPRY